MSFSIKEIKERALKGQNNIWNVLFAEHFAVPLLWLVANFTSLTPNIVTMLSFICFIGAAFLFGTGHFVWAAIVFQFGHWLDIVDGRLAALKQQGSKFGQFLDTFVDVIGVLAMTAAISYYLHLLTGNVLWIWAAAGYGIIVLLLQMLYNVSYNINDGQLLIKKVQVEHTSTLGKFRAFLEKKRLRMLYTNVETNALLFFIAPLAAIWLGPLFMGHIMILNIALLVLLFIVFFIIQMKVLWNK